MNALCHRDYAIAGGAVNVAVYDDRLEIISAGLLPPGISVAKLIEGPPDPRGLIITRIAGVLRLRFRRPIVAAWDGYRLRFADES